MSHICDRFTVVLDANVLYPFRTRDVLLNFAEAGLFRARWSEAILTEWRESLLRTKPGLEKSLESQVAAMKDAFPEALVSGHESLIEALELPDPDDRHVLAAAIKANAEHIVTENLRDFPNAYLAKYQIEAVTADEFLTSTFELYMSVAAAALRATRCAYRNPPMTVGEFLLELQSRGMPRLALAAKQYFELL